LRAPNTLLEHTTNILRSAGCVAAEEEAAELIARADGNDSILRTLVDRRCQGEPLAWLTGYIQFCGHTVLVHPGVYVPRWQSEPMALAALALLPAHGVAVDLCTGAGAIALNLSRGRPDATVLATDIDPIAVSCAKANDVDAVLGDMTSALPDHLHGAVDVVTAVVPYVPTPELAHLPRDVLNFEPRQALDGGIDGTTFLVRAVRESAPFLRPGGSLLLELGGDEADLLEPVLAECGYSPADRLVDEDGDLRAIVCRLTGPAWRSGRSAPSP
jgi:release factor glutamine methyltransferase